MLVRAFGQRYCGKHAAALICLHSIVHFAHLQVNLMRPLQRRADISVVKRGIHGSKMKMLDHSNYL